MSAPSSHGAKVFTWTIEDFRKLKFEKEMKLESDYNISIYFKLIATRYKSALFQLLLSCGCDCPTEPNEPFTAPFELTIIKSNGDEWKIMQGTLRCACYGINYTLQAKIDSDNFFNSRHGLLTDGNLKMQCKVFPDPNTCDHQFVICSLVPKSTLTGLKFLQSDNKALLESGEFSDVTFVVNGTAFHLHKAILSARSAAFRRMLQEQSAKPKEAKKGMLSKLIFASRRSISKQKNQEKQIVFLNMKVQLFETLIQYIYSGLVPELAEHASELFAIANTYQLESLKRLCGESLAVNLNIETAVSTLMFAEAYDEEKLKNDCLDFIRANLKQVRETAGWTTILQAKRVDLLNELIGKLEDPDSLGVPSCEQTESNCSTISKL